MGEDTLRDVLGYDNGFPFPVTHLPCSGGPNGFRHLVAGRQQGSLFLSMSYMTKWCFIGGLTTSDLLAKNPALPFVRIVWSA